MTLPVKLSKKHQKRCDIITLGELEQGLRINSQVFLPLGEDTMRFGMNLTLIDLTTRMVSNRQIRSMDSVSK